MNVVPEKLTAKDFATDQEVRWCPGCGDYAILKSVLGVLPDINVPRENIVFVSGIGCAARFPYYVKTYGFHSIHGRAPAFATGIKLANPELDVWVVAGDGDGLSIGGNHLMHLLRRNVNVQFLLFNNEIYGLTKGQNSPTSRKGTRTPSTPMGSLANPVSACVFSLGAGARFVARSVDTMQKHLPGVLMRAHDHVGTSFVEIIQNCIVYNDGVFDYFTGKGVAADTQIHVEHGRPLLFGSDGNKGLKINHSTLDLEVVTVGENGVTERDVLVHDETNRTLAGLLARMEPPDHPKALGVIYCDPGPTYDGELSARVAGVRAENFQERFNDRLREGHTWTV
ncbi:MAG: 2-oxoacid:ferredoxin oxidoreductase subunit beta [Proteobacteria bacterium]|nr:2-oxoacid:ferredoxin oxidoreductase subunit beta [Pseudomonadota bacterium]